jgi:hypothetical protein
MRFVQNSILVVVSLGLATVIGAAYASHDSDQTAAHRSREKLDALLGKFDEARARGVAIDDVALKSQREQIDAMSAQKDAHLSRLFWYTDLNDAMSEAKRTNRPVLSLRLLGRLDEELSCANSRFFRAILYADPGISQLLRDRFVLHWESVREVPVITIDFGSGRSFTRTITGNSIHYVLSPDGRVIDAVPGLIAPRVFERELTELASISSDPVAIRLHQVRKLERLPVEQFVEADLALPAPTWERIARQMVPPDKARMDARIDARLAARRAVSKSRVEMPLLRQVINPLPGLAQDTRLNMRQLRPTILGWLLASQTTDLKSLNDRVYRELFLTPLDDPLMGLDAPDEFSGLARVR